MEMPKVARCDAAQCSYNMNALCHAAAITVGGAHQICDTFLSMPEKGGVAEVVGAVGACKERECKYNEFLECSAPEGINVVRHTDHADCATYTRDKNVGL